MSIIYKKFFKDNSQKMKVFEHKRKFEDNYDKNIEKLNIWIRQ